MVDCARKRMYGSATALNGMDVITRTSLFVLLVKTPRSIKLLMIVPNVPILSASRDRFPILQLDAPKNVTATDDDGYFDT